MKPLTKDEAYVYYLRATETPFVEISSLLNVTVRQARTLATSANNKARMQGLAYRFTPWMDTSIIGSGSSQMCELVPDTPQPLRGFALLKAMAAEAGL